MKTFKTTILLMWLLCLIQVPALGQSTRNVLDYYLLLPDRLFSCELPPKSAKNERLASLKKKNIQSGYLEATVEGTPMQIALFKDKKNKRDVIGVVINCGAGCMCNDTSFLEYTPDKKWKDANVIPDQYIKIHQEMTKKEKRDVFLYFDLPEKGTTIPIKDLVTGKTVLWFKWQDGKFVLVKK